MQKLCGLIIPILSLKPDWCRCDHADCLPYVFGWPLGTNALAVTSEESDRELSLEMIQNWTDFAKGKLSHNEWTKFAGQETIKIFNNGHGTNDDVDLVNDDSKLQLFKDCYIHFLKCNQFSDSNNVTSNKDIH